MASNLEQHMVKPASEKTDLNVGKLDFGPNGVLTADGTSLELESFCSADKNNIFLANGKSVPVLPALEELKLKTNKGKEFNQDQVVGLIAYAQNCQRLKKLSFFECVLPLSLRVGSLSPFTKLRNIQVSWTPTEHGFHLDSSKGKWVSNSKEATTLEFQKEGDDNLRSLCSATQFLKKIERELPQMPGLSCFDIASHGPDDIQAIIEGCSGGVFIHRDTSKSAQRSAIELLMEASNHDIPVEGVFLRWSFSKIDEDGNLVLSSGLSLPIITSIERLCIYTEVGREMNKHEVNGILNYVQQSQRFKELILTDCKLPSSIPVGPALSTLKSRGVNVFWKPHSNGCVQYHQLDLGSGLWLTKGQNRLQCMCSNSVNLNRDDSKQLQMSTILLLEIASSHDLPISDLNLICSFSGFDGKDIRLESGLSLSSLSSVERITVNVGNKPELTEEELIGLINYGIESPRFKTLWLSGYKLPSSIKSNIIPEESRSRNIKVISSGEARLLNLASGKWIKIDDIQTITEICSDGLIIDKTCESVQSSVIELMVKASNHDIPISAVSLRRSLSNIDEDGEIILSSGLSLPILTSIKKMNILGEDERMWTRHEVYGILNYVQHSPRFSELHMYDCLLPLWYPVAPFLTTLGSRGVKVFWTHDSQRRDEYLYLNFRTGRWGNDGSWDPNV